MKQRVASPNLPDPFNWNENIKWIEFCVSALIGWITFIVFYFKFKAKEKQEFIENVVNITLKKTLDGELQGIKDNVAKLFEYREADRNHIDEKFSKLMSELKTKS